ncbi:putative HTH-type transcriptional repressor ExuR [compost metagenome]
MKKTTMKDIAQKANVSIATVSYVLNDVNNQTIPEATRKHILQIAKELHYIPNLTARSLAKKKTGLVGILLNKSSHTPYWKRQGYLAVVESLEKLLTAAGYHTLLLSLNAEKPSLDIIVERELDAAFLIDVRDETFYSISINFTIGVPLILIDSKIKDKIFKQIFYNYQEAVQVALTKADDTNSDALKTSSEEVCFIMENFNNQSLVAHILQGIHDLGFSRDHIFIIDDLHQLDSISQSGSYKKAIVINEFLGNHIEKMNMFDKLTVICTCNCPEILVNKNTQVITFKEDKSTSAFSIMENLINHIDFFKQSNNIYNIGVKR